MKATQRLRNAKNPNMILPGESWANFENRRERIIIAQSKLKNNIIAQSKPDGYKKVNRTYVNTTNQKVAMKKKFKSMLKKK